jgi:hypothetical protein
LSLNRISIKQLSITPPFRIEIQDKVRHLGSDAREIDQQSIERQREILSLLLIRLKHSDNVPMDPSHSSSTPRCNEAEYDDADADADESSAGAFEAFTNDASSMSYEAPPVAPEWEKLPLPSHAIISSDFKALEINLRKTQAYQQLHQLRELIANKSFQYSHVIRKAPRKDVRTRARKEIKKLTHEIALHARIYSRCRDRLVTLACDELQVLTKDDIRASTAIVNPNEPGSSKLHLSWIWNTARYLSTAGADNNADPTILNECGCTCWSFLA